MVVLFEDQKSLITELKSSENIVCLGPLPSDFSGSGRHQGSGETKPLQHPTSPSASDASSPSSHAQSSDEAQPFAPMHSGPSQANRASSAESIESSMSTANAGTIGGSSSSAGSDAPHGTSKGAATKIPIYLSRNGGAGPTFKTGQFYTMHF
ncbi:hypothetical protein LPJ75_004615 [Coemansia sp. RSA 2598]|nr:hypothetical protein LPJ75_004615 [Coemansia sp. RSA 2598]